MSDDLYCADCVIPVNRGLVAECFLPAIKSCFVLKLIKAAVHLMCLATCIFVATSMDFSLNFPASRLALRKKWHFCVFFARDSFKIVPKDFILHDLQVSGLRVYRFRSASKRHVKAYPALL